MTKSEFISSKKRVDEILNNRLEVIETDKLPNESTFTFNNGYYSWVTAIFIDIRESSSLFSLGDKEKISKVIRSFTSEIIEILRDLQEIREIGIRGDCVYAVYTTPKQNDIYQIYKKSWIINSYMKMLNILLSRKNFPQIKVGIGISTSQELVVKAGRKDVGINNLVWIGDAVTKASNLSSLGNKSYEIINISELTYLNVIDLFTNEHGDHAKSWIKKKYLSELGYFYDCNIVNKAFEEWIDGGMNYE